MTDNATTQTEPIEPEAQPPESSTEEPTSTEELAPDAKARREAAKYRRRLRDTEAERDTLAEQLAAMRRSEVERHAAEQLADPGDLWRSGVEVEQLIADDGGLDSEKIEAAVAELVSERPHYRKPPPAADFDGGARESVEPSGPDFADSLRKAAGGQ